MHYEYNASGEYRRALCPASHAFEQIMPESRAGEAAITGTGAHALGEWALTHGYATQIDERFIGVKICLDKEGETIALIASTAAQTGFPGIKIDEGEVAAATDVVVVDEKIVNGVSYYCRICDSIIQKYKSRHAPMIEKESKIAANAGGTNDFALIVPQKLIIIDYKNGRGVVEAKDNKQLAMYALGIYLSLSEYDRGTTMEITMCIVQPNVKNPFKTWTIGVKDFLETYPKEFFDSHQRCEEAKYALSQRQDMAPFCFEGKHCLYCRGKVLCPLKQNKIIALMRHIQNGNLDDIVSSALLSAEDITKYLSSCHEYALGTALDGTRQWPGFEVSEQKKWEAIRDEAEFKKYAINKGLDVFVQKMKPVGEIKKKLTRAEKDRFIYRPKGEKRLVKGRTSNQTMAFNLPPLLGD